MNIKEFLSKNKKKIAAVLGIAVLGVLILKKKVIKK